ncbi:Putative manganese efflux pump MntP [Saliniradius amylolyticus]|uniref:Putative manganese efflux pump MntP n=1 Tax=Saliniradius amylolyticus TaxID=2183582 RepID=A0A2S2E7Z9_9ALTE|nr:manganese efflux pump MntP family protein [Saliniradius amylolyticus]AWL13330.1 Putative manganese efflux pump MntP [Saliniradius amylolyticus]
MIEVFLLAFALSMDAFAVSIGLGAKYPQRKRTLAMLCAVYFGVFQGLMPLIGYLLGRGVVGWFADYAPWVACGLLVLIGGKMIAESFSEDIGDDIAQVTHRVLFILAIATSIDAMAAGFSLTLLSVSAVVACLLIGVTTFVMSWAGVYVGARSGVWLEHKAELLGGVVLVLIGVRILLI